MEHTFSGKRVLVTGGSSGIGKGIAQVFASLGATVIIIGRQARVFQASQDIGGRVLPYQADVSRYDEVRRVIHDVLRSGPIDILVNNAGIDCVCPFLDVTDELLDRQYRTNVLGAVYCAQLVLPAMMRKRWGRIITISSVTGPLVADPGHSIYAMTKAALIGLTKSWAVEFAPYGITANVICPGYVRTEMSEHSAGAVGEDAESVLADVAAGVPLRRLGTPSEIGDIAAFFAGDGSAYITGQALVVDGGRSTVETAVMGLRP